MAISKDSGGPCFGKFGEDWKIINICSISDTMNYGDVAEYTRVSTHKD
tara:strand:+ start:1041 stop:1184 length:144 start_codon:yes stop_codon:yes gene_type:complete